MRKKVLLLGLGYVFWGLWQLLLSLRIISLYQEFDASAPRVDMFLPIGILIYGFIQIVVYFAKLKNEKLYKILLTIGLVLVGLWLLYISVAGTVSNRQINTTINEFMQSENKF